LKLRPSIRLPRREPEYNSIKLLSATLCRPKRIAGGVTD